MTAKKIAETKRAIENLSPPKTTMQVEGVKHKEWVVTMVDDAFEAKPIERAAKFMQEHEAVVNSANQDSLDSQENQKNSRFVYVICCSEKKIGDRTHKPLGKSKTKLLKITSVSTVPTRFIRLKP